MVGTVLGLLGTIICIHIILQGTDWCNIVGMAVWYIGAGSGSGNPYGIVVATVRFARSLRIYVNDFISACFVERLSLLHPSSTCGLWHPSKTR